MTTGERIKERRKELAMSAEELALKVGLSPATIYRYEKGEIEKVPGDTLLRIGEALYVSPSYLMGWEDKKADPEKDETIRLAEELRNRPGMRLLFDAAKNCTEDDLRNVAAFINNFRKGEDD